MHRQFIIVLIENVLDPAFLFDKRALNLFGCANTIAVVIRISHMHEKAGKSSLKHLTIVGYYWPFSSKTTLARPFSSSGVIA